MEAFSTSRGSFRKINSLLSSQRQSFHSPDEMFKPNDFDQARAIFVHANFKRNGCGCLLGPATHISSFRPAEGNERESATCKQGQDLVAPRNEIGDVVKEKLVVVFRRFVLFARNVGRNRQNDNEGKLGPKFEWPYVMNSSVAMRGPLVSGTWIWHRQHARWHHRYYRTRR